MAASVSKPVVMSGPSGSGKSTLLKRLFQEFNDCFAFSVSHTTRRPRMGEENGKAYHFVSKDTFQDLVKNDGFLEHATFSGNMYGTSKQAVCDIQQTGRICILDVEIKGVKNMKKTDLNPRYIFVKPPSFEVLAERLRSRGTETEESLQKRLDTVKEALDYAAEVGAYDHVIVNDNLDVAYEKLKRILSEDIDHLRKEKMKQR